MRVCGLFGHFFEKFLFYIYLKILSRIYNKRKKWPFDQSHLTVSLLSVYLTGPFIGKERQDVVFLLFFVAFFAKGDRDARKIFSKETYS